MAREFEETAHHKIDKKKFNENWDHIFKKKEDKQETKKTCYKVVNGEVVEISEAEAKRSTRHSTSGLCGEYGFDTFNKEAFDSNYDEIKWQRSSGSDE